MVDAYNAFSSARRSGLVSVIRSVISLPPASICAKGSDVWWRTADFENSVLLEQQDVSSDGERSMASWLNLEFMGV